MSFNKIDDDISDKNAITDESKDSGFVSGTTSTTVEHTDDEFLNKELGKLQLTDNKITGKHILEMLYGYNRYQKGNTFLHQAVLKGNLKQVITIIKITVHPCLLNIENDKYFTALHLAVLSKQSDIARQLVLAGADINIRTKDGNTALHIACYQNDLECLKALTQPINDVEQHQYPQFNMLQHYDIENVNYEGETCIHIAVYNNSMELLKYLVQLGANINAREYLSGLTPLHITIKDNNYALFTYLITEFRDSVDYNMPNYAEKTPYQYAKRTNNSFAENLSERGAIIDSDDSSDDEDDNEDDDNGFDF